jgi:D-alanyl-D-alanine carboxypeptidase
MLKSLLLLTLILLTAAPAVRAELSPDSKSRIDAAVSQVLSSTKVPSASIAVVKDGRIAYLQAYGQARLSPSMEATPQMQYSVGSISKQFTAAAVLLLAQDGKLTLDDPLSKYLPDLTRASEVTIRYRTPPATRIFGLRTT